MKTWYPREVLRMAKEETRLRLKMATDKVRSLLDSGWEPDQMQTVKSVYGDMFAGACGMDKDPYRDLEQAVDHAVWEVRGLPPSDQPNEDKATPLVRDLNLCWLNTSNEFIGELECYIPERRPLPEASGLVQREVEPTLSPERALPAFASQLTALDQLKGRDFYEARDDEQEWEYLSQSLIERTFGKPSSNLDRFEAATERGGFYPPDEQPKFEQRLKSYGALMRSIIAEIRFSMPPEELKGIYGPGEEYDFYRDLSKLIGHAETHVFIVDAYVDDKVFDLYVNRISSAVHVRMLTSRISPTAQTLARMYAKAKPLELRTSEAFHDRVIFIDDRGWLCGQSIKDAASKKPTYLVELEGPALSALRGQHEALWSSATVVI